MGITSKVEECSAAGIDSTVIWSNPQNRRGGAARLGVALRNKGHEAMRQGQLEMAVQFYSQSLRHETSVPLLCYRANAYSKLEMYKDVIHDCTEIISWQPKFWRAYALRGAALHKQGIFAEAMADLRQAKRLWPKRTNHFDKLLAKCRRESHCRDQAFRLQALIQEARKLRPRPFVKGDKRVTPAEFVLRMQECLRVINRVLEEPGSGNIIWKEDELDRWKRVRMRNKIAKKSEQERAQYDTLVIVQRLEELQYIVREGGKEMCQLLGQSLSFSTLLAAYEHQDRLVLEIIHDAVRDGDDTNMRAFIHAEPLVTLFQALQDQRQPVRNIACTLLDLMASYKTQQILTILIHDKMMPLLLKSMHFGSTAEHASSISLFVKLALDPRLPRHLLTLPSLHDLSEGLIRACRADKLITRLHGVQAITTLLEFEKKRKLRELSEAVVEFGTSPEEISNCNELSLLSTFADGGVLRAMAQLLARESELVPEKTETSSSVWENNVERICEEIASTVTDFSEVHECTLRDFNFLSGYAQVLILNVIRAMDFMAYTRRAVEILDQMHAWGLFVPLLSSFPHKLSAISVNALAKFCRRSKRVAMYIANLWPANSSLIVLELANFAKRMDDSQTYQAAILILAELAVWKSFLSSMRRPASFTLLCGFLEDGKSSPMALSAICTCLVVAVTSCDICVEFAETKAPILGRRLLQLWCESRTEVQLQCQVENLMFVLMNKSYVLQHELLGLFENKGSCNFTCASPRAAHLVPYKQPSHPTLRDESAAERELASTHKRIDFQKVCLFLSTLVHSSAKFADLWAGAGLLSIQVAKHFKQIHCYAVNHKRAWVEHTRRLAKQEAVLNWTAVLSKSFDLLPQTLPATLDVAILCLCLDMVKDFALLFRSVRAKLQPQGKLVLIDAHEDLVTEAGSYASLQGLSVVLQPTILHEYFVLVLQRTEI